MQQDRDRSQGQSTMRDNFKMRKCKKNKSRLLSNCCANKRHYIVLSSEGTLYLQAEGRSSNSLCRGLIRTVQYDLSQPQDKPISLPA